MVASIEHMTDFGTGYRVDFPEVNEQAKWLQWYAGRYSTLLPEPTLNNGGKLYDAPDQLNLPLFRIASDFYSDAILAETPAASADNAAALQWIAEHERIIERALLRGTRYWSVLGTAVWTAEPGFIRAVNPLFYYRVGEPDQHDALVGHIIAYPYKEYEDSIRNNPQLYDSLPDNRIKVLKFYGARSTMQVFEFDSSLVIGSPLTPLSASPITAICVAGTGDSWYPGLQTVASNIIRGYTLRMVDVNRYRNRIEYLPTGLVDSMAEQAGGDAPGNPTGLRRTIDALIAPHTRG